MTVLRMRPVTRSLVAKSPYRYGRRLKASSLCAKNEKAYAFSNFSAHNIRYAHSALNADEPRCLTYIFVTNIDRFAYYIYMVNEDETS